MPAADSLIRLWSLLPGDAWRPGGLELTERAMERCFFPVGACLLDVGSGRGATVRHLRERYRMNAWCLEQSLEALAAGPAGRGIRGVAQDLPLASAILDGVFCECVLSLLPFPEKALNEFNRVLKAGGRLVVTDLYRQDALVSPAHIQDRGPSCLAGARRRRDWEKRIAACGFEIHLWEDHSRHLVSLTARLVWEVGSRKALWDHLASELGTGGSVEDQSAIRPGYFLLLARKKTGDKTWTI